MGILYIIVFVFITILASFSLSQVYAEPIVFDNNFMVQKFSTGLEYPTTMTFVEDDILVLEKSTGKVIRIKDNGIHYNESVLDVSVDACWESGFLGITSISNHVFLYFSESESGFDTVECHDQPVKNKVYRYDWNGENLTNPILIKELPGNLDGDHRHHGGAMTKSQNNEIYFVIGDLGQHATFQNIPNKTIYETSSIFKIDTENNNVELHAMGIRNSFGLAVDPVTGYLWDTENSEHNYDEINLVKPGFNSGWKRVMGPVDRDNPDIAGTQTIPPPFENFVYSDPEFSFERAVAVTAIEFPDNDGFEKYSDWLFVGDYNNGRIYKFQLNSDKTGFVFSNPDLSDLVLDDNDEMDEILFAKGFQGITDIEFHNGAMYVVVIGDGSIYKIYPKEYLSPLEQYQNNVPHKKIVCAPELMPIMKNTGYIDCVDPKTALTLVNTLNGSINHPDMPKIELRFQDLSGLSLEHLDLSNSDFTGTNFDDAKISHVNFTNADLSFTNLSGKDLTGTILTGADLTGANLTDVDLSGKDLTDVELRGADLTGTRLMGADFTEASLTNIGLPAQRLDFIKWAGVTLPSIDLSDKDLTGTILTDADLTGVILTGVDLSTKDLTETRLTGADLTDAILPSGYLSGKDFTKTIFDGVDLSGKDLSKSNFHLASFKNTNLKNANLSEALFVEVDLTKIKNKSLAGADLSGASFAHSNLSGVELSGVILAATNFWKADLSGQDLTIIYDINTFLYHLKNLVQKLF